LHFSLLFLGRSNNVYKFPSLIIPTLQIGGGGGGDVCAPPIALARGEQGVLFFMISKKLLETK
jgi:hypothetical protein